MLSKYHQIYLYYLYTTKKGLRGTKPSSCRSPGTTSRPTRRAARRRPNPGESPGLFPLFPFVGGGVGLPPMCAAAPPPPARRPVAPPRRAAGAAPATRPSSPYVYSPASCVPNGPREPPPPARSPPFR
ncbi:hypothetical protein PAHAL_1G112200 [Panicum hallii]|uniref:Uncharacterized protein n=1 Tax=Panicum hallii TaxID=206008 RepID=A0A2T8KUV6_9POAL|nr:hypothetical protein PAHAL_1G112200 [Panicum hallii]